MKPKHLLSDYLNGRISGEELRSWLAKDPSREAQETLAILNVDEGSRNALLDFAPPLDSPERLAEAVAAVQSWVEPEDQVEESQSSKGWLSKLVPALDVTGHAKPGKKPRRRNTSKKKGKKAPARRKTRSPKKRSPRARKKT